MTAETSYGAHSARVKMSLIVHGTLIRVTQMGPDFLFIEPAGDHPPGEATIILEVDDKKREWKVALPEGISRGAERVVLGLCA
jgi:hypothetical protein